LSPDVIAERLHYICSQEGISFDPKVLPLIAEITGCHIRDALKAVEGVSMLGPVDADSVSRYLHLDLNVLYLSLLDSLGSSLESVSEALSALMRQVSPATCYDQLAKLCLLAFKANNGAVKVPRYLDSEKVISLGERHGTKLIEIASYLSSRPARPTPSMLECDLLRLHNGGSFSFSPSRDYQPSIEPVKTASQSPVLTSSEDLSEKVEVTLQDDPSPRDQKENKQGTIERSSSGLTDNGVHVDQRAVKRKKVSNGEGFSRQSKYELQPLEFCRLLALRVSELSEESGGSSGRINMGRT
jgi:DNA polymerase III gamma/tau subunit